MKNDVTFVTCVYDDLHNTLFSGRHNRGTHYAFSLAQINQINTPIYCFTDYTNLYKFFPAILNYGINNLKFINYNLNESPYHERIQQVKQYNKQYIKSSSWNSRCVEIMWGKFDWLIHVIDKIGIEKDKYVYWIDAGLSHPGVIPKKYNNLHDKKEYYSSSHEYSYRFFNNKIFNKDFPDFLVSQTGKNKLLHFLCTKPQHNDHSPLDLPNKKYYKGTAVGGLFGGDIQKLYDWCIQGKKICDQLLDKCCLIKEEDILTYLINYNIGNDKNFEEQLSLFLFNTWYHEDWDKSLYDPKKDISFSDFFEKML